LKQDLNTTLKIKALFDRVILVNFQAEDDEMDTGRVRNGVHQAREKLAEMPEMGHTREDLTARPVKFWSVYSYLIVYDPSSSPLSVIAVLRGVRDLEQLLKDR
jgi:plasmid stabilization system protein ParE